MATHEQDNPLQSIVARCWEDEAFKERLLADPTAVLAEAGVQIPEGVTLRVAIDTDTERTLVIPAPPVRELSERELADVAAGDCLCFLIYSREYTHQAPCALGGNPATTG